MLEMMLSRPQSFVDQLDTVRRLLASSSNVDGAPGAIRSVAYGAFPEINVGLTQPVLKSRHRPRVSGRDDRVQRPEDFGRACRRGRRIEVRAG